ncbi:MAG: hypothetical protein HY960_10995 [Ignavibacteriae bacterium]|nr:hypothetical protein [Ignavibacteriota bacterium]
MTALFLGAGASVPFGYMTTPQIFPLILRELSKNNLYNKFNTETENQRRREILSGYLNEMLSGLEYLQESINQSKEYTGDGIFCMSDVEKNLPLITEVLSMLDFSLSEEKSLTSRLSGYQLTEFRQLLDQAISFLIVQVYQERYEKLFPANKSVTGKFIQWIIKQLQENSLGVITTNYDIGIESKLYEYYQSNILKISNEFDFGFAWRDVEPGTIHDRAVSAKVRFYKLHGSINWLYCDVCDHMYINFEGSIVHQAYKKDDDYFSTCHCSNRQLRSTLIAPSFVRENHNPNIVEVW